MSLYEERHDLKVYEKDEITLNAVQGESQSREFAFNLIEKPGDNNTRTNAQVINKYVNLTGCDVRLHFLKPDGKKVSIDGVVGEAEKGDVSFIPKQQAFTAGGKSDCVLEVISNGEVLRATGVTLNVEKTSIDAELASTNELSALTNALVSVNAFKNDFEASIGKITEDTEVIMARGGAPVLADRFSEIENGKRLKEGAVSAANFTPYIQGILLNPDNLIADPLMENAVANWKPSASNKGALETGNNEIRIDGRAEGKGYCSYSARFDVPKAVPLVLELEIMRLDDTYPTSYPIGINLFDTDGNNLTNRNPIYPTASQLKLNEWYKLRVALPATADAVKLTVTLTISTTGGYLAYRRPKLVKGTDTTLFDTFKFDLNAQLSDINSKVQAISEAINISSPLQGKGIRWFGDSIMRNAGSWADLISQKYSMDSINYAVSGMTLTRREGGLGVVGTFINNVTAANSDRFEYNIFEGGVNDCPNNLLGAPTEGYNTALNEFETCGAVESICRHHLKTCPNKKIGFIFVHQLGDDAYNRKLGTWFESIKIILKKYSVPYLDLYHHGGICARIPENRTALFKDNIHLNDAGYAATVQKVINFIESL